MSLDPIQIREALRAWIVRTLPHQEGDVMVNEMCFVGKKRRADLVHANGRLSAFEIKSEADSLARWSGQEEAYLRVFDNLWLCCHSKHVAKALHQSSKVTGILVVDDFSNIAVVRSPKDNAALDILELSQLLWRSELDKACRQNGLPVLKKERVAQARERLVAALPQDVVKQFVLECIKLRYC